MKGGNPLTSKWGRSSCSVFLCQAPVFHFNALLAMQAGVVAWAYQQPAADWIDQLLEELYVTYQQVAGVLPEAPKTNQWQEYIAALSLFNIQSYALCLTTYSEKNPAYAKCDGLNKYIMALYALIRGGARYSMAHLWLPLWLTSMAPPLAPL